MFLKSVAADEGGFGNISPGSFVKGSSHGHVFFV